MVEALRLSLADVFAMTRLSATPNLGIYTTEVRGDGIATVARVTSEEKAGAVVVHVEILGERLEEPCAGSDPGVIEDAARRLIARCLRARAYRPPPAAGDGDVAWATPLAA